jgi:hypothetical protein
MHGRSWNAQCEHCFERKARLLHARCRYLAVLYPKHLWGSLDNYVDYFVLIRKLLHSVFNIRWEPVSPYRIPHWTQKTSLFRKVACSWYDVPSKMFCTDFVRVYAGSWFVLHEHAVRTVNSDCLLKPAVLNQECMRYIYTLSDTSRKCLRNCLDHGRPAEGGTSQGRPPCFFSEKDLRLKKNTKGSWTQFVAPSLFEYRDPEL